MDIDTAISLIRGKGGTKVTLTIARAGTATPLVVPIVRESIAIPTVDTENRKDAGVFIIHLYTFSANSTVLFANALNEFRATGYTNLIIDLRNNLAGLS